MTAPLPAKHRRLEEPPVLAERSVGDTGMKEQRELNPLGLIDHHACVVVAAGNQSR
jgi:hypothetical protein